MIALELPLSLLAVLAGVASLTLAAYVLARHRTRLLRLFMVGNAAIFAMTVGFVWRSLESGLRWMAEGAAHREAMLGLADVLAALALIVQALGGMVMSAVLPGMSQGLVDRQPAAWHRNAGIGSMLGLGLLLAIHVLGGAYWADWAAAGLLFGNIALGLAMVMRQVRHKPGQGDGMPRRPLQPELSGWLGRFLILSLVFFPLFILDMLISRLPSVPLLRLVDNTSLPLYFLAVNLGAIMLLRAGLDHPPLMEADKLSGFGRERFGLTQREAEVLEYVLDGFTLKDLAGVLKISAKTAENHLYNVYQKTGVNNRIQLFQMFTNQRRD